MKRDELLELLILDADAGLSNEEAEPLRAALRDDASLREEQAAVHDVWKSLRSEARSLKLDDDFGWSQVRKFLRKGNEGTLIGTTIRWAAAVLFFVTLARGMSGPVSIGTVHRGGAAKGEAGTSSIAPPIASSSGREFAAAELFSGTTLRAEPSEVVHAELLGGLEMTLQGGEVVIDTPRSLRLGRGETEVVVAVGERATDIHCPGVVISARNARFTLRTSDSPVRRGLTRLRVSEGAVIARQGGIQPVDASMGVMEFRAFPPRTLPAPVEPRRPLESVSPIPPLPDRDPLNPGDEPSDPPIPPPQPPPQPPPSDDSGDGDDDRVHSKAPLMAAYGGTVVAPGGEPVPESLVILRRVPSPDLAFPEPSRTFNLTLWKELSDARGQIQSFATSDADGQFEFLRVSPGFYRVEVLVPKNVFLSDLPPRFLRLAGEEVREERLALEPGFSLGGRVVDEFGNPLEDVLVRREGRETTTDLRGRFRLHGQTRTGQVWFEHEERAPLLVDLEQWSGNPVVLPSVAPLDVRVRHSLGNEPIRAVARWTSGGRLFERVSERVDNGLLRISGCPPAAELSVTVSAPGVQTQVLERPKNPTGELGPIDLLPAQSFELSLESQDGNPLRRATATLHTEGLLLQSDSCMSGTTRFLGEASRNVSLVVNRGDHFGAYPVTMGATTRVVVSPPAPRHLEVRDRRGEIPREPWALAVVVDGATERWLAVQPLPLLQPGRFAIPSLEGSLANGNEQGLHVRLLIGCKDVVTTELVDRSGLMDLRITLGGAVAR